MAMTDWKPVTRQELLKALNESAEAIKEREHHFKNGSQHVEDHINVLACTLANVISLLGMTVRYLTIDRPEGK